MNKLQTISRQGTLTTGYNFKTKRYWEFNGLTPELTYLMGVFFGDGCITRYKSRDFEWFKFTLRSIDRDFVEYTARCVDSLIGYLPKVHTTENRKNRLIYYISIGNNDLFCWMKTISNGKTLIPNLIWNAPKELKVEFLSGFMDSDGWCAEDRTRDKFRYRTGFCGSSVWIDDMAKMFERLGVVTGKRQTRKSEWSTQDNILYMVNTESLIKSGINFKIARKQKRLEMYKQLYM